MTRIDLPSEPWREPDTWSRESAMLAHDVRSALNGVTGGIAVLERSSLDPEIRVQMERIAGAAEILAEMLGDLLGETGGAPLPAGPEQEGSVALAGLLRRLERRWGGEAAAKGLVLRVETTPGLPDALAVPIVDMMRVMGNLFSNAVKFTPSGSVGLLVRREPDRGLSFVLTDDGPGLGDCAPERLFEFGFRSDGAGAGQGIGLHVAKTLSERMGADLRIAERPAGGLEAQLRLPARLCVEDADAAQDRGDPLPDLSGARILLAEDNPTNQMVASHMLSSLKASVSVAADGMDALALFEREAFDIVVVDIEMPRMSGLEVIRAIRARSDRRARTPIVALTAYAMQEHRLRIAEAGADGLISKPIVSTESLGRVVAQHLRTSPFGSEPAEAVGAEDEPAIDLATFRSLADAIGAEMMTELLDRIVADLENAREALSAALEPLDPASIRMNSHILISVAGAFGAARLRRRAAELNAAANAGETPDLGEGLRACLAEIEPALDFAKAQRNAC
jgi:two-component system, OmpR family, aerobic respiration control sensor histidine kinase ArcB